jgi:hypothetical protein
MIESDKGVVNNLYDPEDGWANTSGALHMHIKKNSEAVVCRKYS